METKHTPAPWQIEPVAATFSTWQRDFLITHVSNDLRSHVCRLFDASLCNEHGTTEANARLIAAAPDLLAALELYLMDCEIEKLEHNSDTYNAARAAIAKATQ